MSRFKMRSSADIAQKKRHLSLFSRTLSASKFCRTDVVSSQIDASAHRFADTKRSKVSNSSENRAQRIMTMQQQMGEMEEELRREKERFNVSELEKHKILDLLKAKELEIQLESTKKSLETSRNESRTIEALESELAKARRLASAKAASLDEMNKELSDLKETEKRNETLLHKNNKRIRELEDEAESRKASESRMSESLSLRAEGLESSKIEAATLCKIIESLEEKLSSGTSSRGEEKGQEIEIGRLKLELQSARESEKNLLEETRALKNEWRLAIEAEEKSAKAMEDLALALKEVVAESNRAKEMLETSRAEMKQARVETSHLRRTLEEARQEAELHKNTADRLRLEAEETLLALNGKEMGFVSCIRKAEEELAAAQRENTRLSEALKAAEHMTRAAREETYKLRDILKQAINEANAAKAAASIATEENSLLKDSLSEREERLHFLARENERLRTSEAAAHENTKQLKILLSRASADFKSQDLRDENKEKDNEEEEEIMNGSNMDKSFSFDLEDLKFMNEPEGGREVEEDPAKAEALKGSIFDANAETPKSEPRTPQSNNPPRGMFLARMSEDFDRPAGGGEAAGAEGGTHRRTKTMFQRVGDLLTIRRSFHRKEAPIEQAVVTTQP